MSSRSRRRLGRLGRVLGAAMVAGGLILAATVAVATGGVAAVVAAAGTGAAAVKGFLASSTIVAGANNLWGLLGANTVSGYLASGAAAVKGFFANLGTTLPAAGAKVGNFLANNPVTNSIAAGVSNVKASLGPKAVGAAAVGVGAVVLSALGISAIRRSSAAVRDNPRELDEPRQRRARRRHQEVAAEQPQGASDERVSVDQQPAPMEAAGARRVRRAEPSPAQAPVPDSSLGGRVPPESSHARRSPVTRAGDQQRATVGLN